MSEASKGLARHYAPAPSLERLSQVRARTGLSRSEIYRRVAAGDFPQPVKLGARASAWPEHEVSAWIADRIAARDKGGAS